MVVVEFRLYLVNNIYILVDLFGHKIRAIFPEHSLHRFIPLLQSPPDTVSGCFCLHWQFCCARHVQCITECIKSWMSWMYLLARLCLQKWCSKPFDWLTGDMWRYKSLDFKLFRQVSSLHSDSKSVMWKFKHVYMLV